jgi:hypothetical protein
MAVRSRFGRVGLICTDCTGDVNVVGKDEILVFYIDD